MERCASLHVAARKGDAPEVRRLVARGADVHGLGEESPEDGCTALHIAAACGNTKVVKVFVRLGADVHAQDADGVTALQAAAGVGHFEVVKALVALGANVHTIAVGPSGTCTSWIKIRALRTFVKTLA